MAARKYRFERLTPIDNMDLNVYEEAIDYVFSNSDVKNVAISGAYSAGKSSVLASYKKKHGELRFLHISLAHFKSTDQESDAEVKESTLEGKILNQLIHQIPSEKMRQFVFSVLAILVAVGLYFLLKPYFGTETVSWMCILGAAPFAALGFITYHGMTAEQFLWAWLRSELLEPKELRFEASNLYYEALKDKLEGGKS